MTMSLPQRHSGTEKREEKREEKLEEKNFLCVRVTLW